MKRLANGRSPRWAFMEKFIVPSYDTDEDYLIRWRLIQTPLFGIYLHKFEGPDPRDTLHDHPWNFVSIILRGGYVERRLNPKTMTVNENHKVRFINVLKAKDSHAIIRILRNPTWSLLFVGRRQRTWGYWEKQILIDCWRWTEFDKHKHALEFDMAMARRKNAK